MCLYPNRNNLLEKEILLEQERREIHNKSGILEKRPSGQVEV